MKIVKIKIKVVKIPGGGFHLLIKSKIFNDKHFLLVDTGASNTIFDYNNEIFSNIEYKILEQENSGSGFNSAISDIRLGKIDRISFGRYKMKNFECMFTSMNHVNELYSSFNIPNIVGILGCDFLLKHKAVINLQDKILFLRIS